MRGYYRRIESDDDRANCVPDHFGVAVDRFGIVSAIPDDPGAERPSTVGLVDEY